MTDPYLMIPFMKYLNPSDGLTPTSELGLVPNAPLEAVEAYKEYQKYERARADSEEEWE